MVKNYLLMIIPIISMLALLTFYGRAIYMNIFVFESTQAFLVVIHLIAFGIMTAFLIMLLRIYMTERVKES